VTKCTFERPRRVWLHEAEYIKKAINPSGYYTEFPRLECVDVSVAGEQPNSHVIIQL